MKKKLQKRFSSWRNLLPFISSLVSGFLLITVLSVSSFAQQIEVTGTVTTTAGEPLPGVTIILQGTTTGTTTDFDGNYRIMAPADGVLIFSFIGFRRVEENIDGRSRIDVSMMTTIADLQEMIVTGYTAQRRADITGAVSTVNVESVSRQSTVSALQRLDGRVAGVTVESSGSPGSRSTVRIRGVSSFQNNEPLYIIDGTPVEDSFLNFINANDIESMQVLKDASAASIYGSRASNGVVIIETKKGRASAGPQVSVDMRLGRATPARGLDDILITDPLEYMQVVVRAHENDPGGFPTNIYGDMNNPSLPNFIWPNDGVNQTMNVDESTFSFPDNLIMRANQSGTDWFNEVFGSAFTQDYNIGISGGSDNNRYNVSFNFVDQAGTSAFTRFQRGTVRVNTEFDAGRFTIGENITLAIDESFGGLGDPGGFAEDGIMGKDILMQPIVPVFDIQGNFASGKAVSLGNQTNPLKNAYANKDDKTRNTRIFGNVFARGDVLDNLAFTTRFGFNIGENSNRTFNPIFPENSEPTFTNSISEGFSNFTDWTFSNTLTFVESFDDKHNINVLAGQESRRFTNSFIGGGISNLISTDVNSRFIQAFLADNASRSVGSGGSTNSLLSFLGKIDYNFDEKYLLSFTIRRDGSSNFGPNNRWATFPAASAGWRLSSEPFLQNSDFFTNLMLRFGWGKTGNQNIPSARIFSFFGGGTGDTFFDITGSGSSIVPGFRQTSLGNPDLKWEEVESFNFGLDSEFFEGRVNFEIDIYERTTNDMLFNPPTPATAGVAAPPIVNIGQMRNRGIDFSIGYRGNINRDLQFSVNFNGSHYRNEIRSIDGEQEFFFGPVSTRFGTQVINMVGQPIGAFFGLVADGIFMNQAEVDAHAAQDGAAPGRLRFRDVNGDGQITSADRTIIGDPHPDFTAGLDFGFQWKNWDLNATLFGTFGNDIFNVQNEFMIFRNFSTNVRRDLLTRSAIVENGQVINPDADFPRIDITDTFSNEISSFSVENGSYVRLRNLQIGYTFPVDVMPALGLRNLRVYFQGENLFTITNYSGLDPSLPASNVFGSGGDIRDQARGIDRGAFPSNKTLSLGLSVNF
ncbi:MAG: SusC/RagA family TonB-linked outer membrane protein [Balneolaceae bacterium]